MGITTYLLSQLFQYETNKVVIINSKRVSIINRLIQTCILAYTVGYVLIHEKGYQTFDDVRSAITSKVKGLTETNYSEVAFKIKEHKDLYNRVWDSIEYIIPPSENGAFFIMTNAVITPNQTQSLCDETVDIKSAWCGPGYPPCPVGKIFKLGNGVTTGRCINSTQETGVKVCEVKAWCPVEFDELPLNNIMLTFNKTYLRSCYYNEETNPFCPIFRIWDIIKEAGENLTDMSIKGGVVAITIRWDCDLDWDFMKYCVPKYSFRRLDSREPMIAPGWNFRFSYNHEFGRRTMVKAYGIKFVLETIGRAGKFDLVPMLLNVGAGLGLMEVSSIIGDLVVLLLANSRNEYKKRKFEYIEGED